MARGVNKVILIGNLGQDPEVRHMPDGNQVVNITLATSESWTDKNTQQKQERTEWHRVVFFGKLAEIVGQYLRKGSKIYVEGALRTRKWQGQDGQDRYTTEIVCDMNGQMQMLDGAPDNNGQRAASQQQAYQPQQPPQDHRGGRPQQQPQQPPRQMPPQGVSQRQQPQPLPTDPGGWEEYGPR